ncbi:MAG: hypothetical protein NTX12_01590, partial [Actinobacteria bacterium]|nr:hypothetical protein [Actinomycetota bacterium]
TVRVATIAATSPPFGSAALPASHETDAAIAVTSTRWIHDIRFTNGAIIRDQRASTVTPDQLITFNKLQSIEIVRRSLLT